MSDYGLPVLYTLFIWWFSTGVILYLDGLPRGTFRWSLLGATAMAGAGLWGLAASADAGDVLGAYCGFTCGLLVWAWVETTFLTGLITGPVRAPCPEGCTGWPRFRLAVLAILHHEIAILVAGAAILAITWGQPNQVGLWTFLTLWIMRQSAKLNVFLGVRNLNEQFLPEHLRYLATFFTRAPMNLLFPLSVTAATLVCALLFQAAQDADPLPRAGLILVGTLLALAVLEHWFLVLPVPAERLWDWGLRSRRAAPAAHFSAALDGRCDPEALRRVLDAVARGAFGDVEQMRGTALGRDGWIQFYVAEGRAGMAALAPRAGQQARVTVIGRALDGVRLSAALRGAVPA